MPVAEIRGLEDVPVGIDSAVVREARQHAFN
jgi:hypothetical protein